MGSGVKSTGVDEAQVCLVSNEGILRSCCPKSQEWDCPLHQLCLHWSTQMWGLDCQNVSQPMSFYFTKVLSHLEHSHVARLSVIL